MEKTRPTRTKKLTAAIINPDNVAKYTLTSHKTAASAARSAGPSKQAVTPSESAGPGDSQAYAAYLDEHHAAIATAQPPGTPPSTTENAGSDVDPDHETSEEDIGKHTGAQVEGMDQFIKIQIT